MSFPVRPIAAAVAVTLLVTSLTGCGTMTGIPSHGGGKRFAVEQRLVAASVRSTLMQIDVSPLKGKKVAIMFEMMQDEGGGTLNGGRLNLFTALTAGYVQSPIQSTTSQFQVFNLNENGTSQQTQNSTGQTIQNATSLINSLGYVDSTGSGTNTSTTNNGPVTTTTGGTTTSTTNNPAVTTTVNNGAVTTTVNNGAVTTTNNNGAVTTTINNPAVTTTSTYTPGTVTTTTGGTTTTQTSTPDTSTQTTGANTVTQTTGATTNTQNTGATTNTQTTGASTNTQTTAANTVTGSTTSNGTQTTGANTSTTNGGNTSLSNQASSGVQDGSSRSVTDSSSRTTTNGSTSSNKETLSPTPVATQTQTKGQERRASVTLSHQGMGEYQNVAIPKSDITYLTGMVRNYLILNGVKPVNANTDTPDALLYVAVDIFGTVRSRFDIYAYNSEDLKAETAIEMFATDLAGNVIMRPRGANKEAKYKENYFLWAGPFKTDEEVRDGKGTLVNFSEVDGSKPTYESNTQRFRWEGNSQ